MYQSHFGLRELPFGLTPDTEFIYTCASHHEALNTLLVAVKNGEGFIKITGEVGTGKTLLCRKFLGMLGDAHITAYIPNPYLKPAALLLALAEELRVTVEKDDQHHVLQALTDALLRFAAEGKSVVLCLDEAQAMPLQTLETLRLLTNLETEKRKLLQVVLFGQPELDVNLAQTSVRQLRQRITFESHLGALAAEELDGYLAHRLRAAGYGGNRLFLKSAVRTLHRASRGVPRLVNVIAHKSMLLAFGEGVEHVAADHVRAAAADTTSARAAPRWWLGFAVAVAAGVALALSAAA